MPDDSAHKSGWETSEAVFGIPFLFAVVLEFIVPVSLPGWLHSLPLILIGVALIISGIVLIILARKELAKQLQPASPGIPTTRIVTTGVFSISRNPLYLGCVCLLAGAGLAISLPWVLLMLLASFIICHFVLIVPEERYLAAKFGQEYHTYANLVYRWLGHRNHLRKKLG
jgi:protein-S-isoprenylcysteine O-methyltransferase Ste14